MPSEIQKRIRSLREKEGYSQEKVADDLNINRNTYAYQETEAKQVRDDIIEKLASYFKVSTNFIRYGLTEKPKTVEEPKNPPPLPNILTNKDKKLIEMFKCLSYQKQIEIRDLIEYEFKLRNGTNKD